MILADSDVLIDFLRGRQPARGWLEAALQTDSVKTTVINQFELLAGARGPAAEQTVKDLLDKIEIVPLVPEAAAAAGRIQRHLSASGSPIGMADSLIAGVALTVKAKLLTRNRRHFERVAGLQLIDPPA